MKSTEWLRHVFSRPQKYCWKQYGTLSPLGQRHTGVIVVARVTDLGQKRQTRASKASMEADEEGGR